MAREYKLPLYNEATVKAVEKLNGLVSAFELVDKQIKQELSVSELMPIYYYKIKLFTGLLNEIHKAEQGDE